MTKEKAGRSIRISPRQREVFTHLWELYGGRMEARHRHYLKIADKMGLTQGSNVLGCLYALREKGFVESIGSSMVRPDEWVATSPHLPK